MKKVLIISFSPITRDPRVMRQIKLLENIYDLTVVGYGAKPEMRCRFLPVSRRPLSRAKKLLWGSALVLGANETYYWSQSHVREAYDALRSEEPDLIIANDLSALPLALRLANGRPVMYDAHEYAPDEFADSLHWRVTLGRYNWALCTKYLAQASSMLTVSDGLATEYRRNFGVNPTVLYNAPVRQYLSAKRVVSGEVKMIHHGIASSARKLENTIEVMNNLDSRFSLDLMLVPEEGRYLSYLKEIAKSNCRIRFVNPVEMPRICESINGYDIGLFLLRPDNINYKHALPNKFFEFIQARLAVAIGPSPEMAGLVQRHGCGVISDTFEPKDLAKRLSSLDDSAIMAMKHGSDRAANLLCFEASSEAFKSTISALLS